MEGPEDQAAAAGDRLLAGHADREQTIQALKDAFVQDRLTSDELDVRAGRAFTARTRAELTALTADIPGYPAAGPARRPAVIRPRLAQRRLLVRTFAASVAAWPSRSALSYSPRTFLIRMASAIPIIRGAASAVWWPLSL